MTVPTILVVDPSEDQRAILTTLLRDRGYRVLDTPSAADALRLVEVHAPDLILGEHPVGEPEGDPLCVTLLGHPDTAQIPFLALTSRAMPDELASARETHPAGVLLKPVPLHRLLAHVEAVVGAGGAEAPGPGAGSEPEVGGGA